MIVFKNLRRVRFPCLRGASLSFNVIKTSEVPLPARGEFNDIYL